MVPDLPALVSMWRVEREAGLGVESRGAAAFAALITTPALLLHKVLDLPIDLPIEVRLLGLSQVQLYSSHFNTSFLNAHSHLNIVAVLIQMHTFKIIQNISTDLTQR